MIEINEIEEKAYSYKIVLGEVDLDDLDNNSLWIELWRYIKEELDGGGTFYKNYMQIWARFEKLDMAKLRDDIEAILEKHNGVEE